MGRQSEHQKRKLVKGLDKYSKISHKDKLILLKRVFCDRQEIKKTAEELQINYSTAKTLMRRFKTRGERINHEFFEGVDDWFKNYGTQRNRCGYHLTRRCQDNTREDRMCDHKGEEDSRESSHKLQEDHTSQKPLFKPSKVILCQQVLFKE